MFRQLVSQIVLVASALLALAPVARAQSLEQRLLAEPAAELAADARALGDAARGATAFFSARLGCAQCHAAGADGADGAGQTPSVGPDLARIDLPQDDADFVHAILRPSQKIDPQYQSLQVLTIDGVFQGLPVHDDAARLVLRTGAGDGDSVEIDPSEIESRRTSSVSLMPTGQVNGLRDRGEFLDLVAYLKTIAHGGPNAARRLQPAESDTRLALPEYESRVDHAGMIASWDGAAYDRGRAIYEGLCINCHGSLTAAGSLPTAPRFASSPLKRGSDPFSMYQTLTHGSGMMVPQTWMVPQQKYDVIHYIREHFFREHNHELLTPLSDEYLASLPAGDTRGPRPRRIEPWRDMDYGSMLMTTLEFGDDGANIAQKGITIRLDAGAENAADGGVANGTARMTFEHDTLRVAGVWSGEEFIDWHGIQFDGRHGVHPRVLGQVHLQNPTGPGWANPATDSFEDTARVEGRDGRRYGPLPAEWAKYRGVYRHGREVVLHYTVGDTECLEKPGWVEQPDSVEQPGSVERGNGEVTGALFTRTLNLGPRPHDLRVLVATLPSPASRHDPAADDAAGDSTIIVGGESAGGTALAASVAVDSQEASGGDASGGAVEWQLDGERLCLRIAAGQQPLRLAIATADLARPLVGGTGPEVDRSLTAPLIAAAHAAAVDLTPLTGGGPANWPLEISSRIAASHQSDAWRVEEIVRPTANPWQARTRVTGFDFLDADTMAVCTWDGDVWLVRGVDTNRPAGSEVTWRRIAAGLFQPLGVLVVDGQIMLSCRDQLVRLEDRNGDGEADYYACFNSDHQVTEHFHEFAMGLQRDAEGNFFYAKSARHALPAVVPHHGTLLRVDPTGASTEIVATGFRAANGVCLNPDGTFIVTDQEGHWNPKNRINWVREEGFYGNMFGYHDVTDASDEAMQQPLCWITNSFDRSPAELLWVPDDAWGPLAGSLLNLSYGYGRVYIVPHEHLSHEEDRGNRPQHATVQGAMCPLPLPDFPTGLIRGRFDPAHRYLYTGGLFAWAGSRQDQEGGLFRIAYEGGNANLPTAITSRGTEIELRFSNELDAEAVAETDRYQFRTWALRRTARYGSDHHDERELKVTEARLGADRRTLVLTIPDLAPNWSYSLSCDLKDAEGNRFQRLLHGTIHTLE